jgi:hypothetical protein
MDKKPVFIILGVVIVLAGFVIWAIYSSPGSRDVVPAPKVISQAAVVSITDDQIYREYERCMNSAKGYIDSDKLEARRQAAVCVTQLAKYGDARAKRAFNIYWNLD